ncbi:MAG: arginine--tRNA ligase [Ignavibacteria bacterium]
MDIKKHISAKLKSALKECGIETDSIALERPKEGSNGDISSNAAMMFAKKAGSKPREFAEGLIASLGIPDSYITGAEVAGPGFINFFISDNYFRDKLAEILEKSAEYGRLDVNKGKTANLEWVSANPTGPLHTGHGRQTALGKAIANLLEWTGYTVTREYYYNDAGKQMETLARSVYARYRQIFEPEFPFPEDGYSGEYVKEIAGMLFEKYRDELVDTGDKKFKEAGEEWCFNSIRYTLKRMGIIHNIFFNETSLYESGKIKEALEEFEKRGLSYKKDDAIWLKTSELLKDKKDAKDKVIVKSTGEPTYRLPDMVFILIR